MELSNAEIKHIADAALVLAAAIGDARVAEEKIRIVDNLSSSLIKVKLDEGLVAKELIPYNDKVLLLTKEFFQALGVTEDSSFWDYVKEGNHTPPPDAPMPS